MEAGALINIIGADFYTGVPDSQLKSLCNCLMDTYGINALHHIMQQMRGIVLLLQQDII